MNSKELVTFCRLPYVEETAINVCIQIKFHNADRHRHCKCEQHNNYLKHIRYNWKEYAGIY